MVNGMMMKHSKLEVLCAFVFIVSFVSCNPQRQGKGLGDMMENIWGGFSDQLDEFQVTSFFIVVEVCVLSLNVIFSFRIPPNQHLAIISVQSNRRSWTTKTDGSRAWRKSRASAQKGNYIYHRIFLISSVYILFSIYEMIDYHKWWSILGRFLTSLLMSLIPLLIDSGVDPFFNLPIP